MRFNESRWFTERSYARNYEQLPESSGIYLFVKFTFEPMSKRKIRYKVLYVGMSRNIKLRIQRHPLLRKVTRAISDKLKKYKEKHPNSIRLEDVIVYFQKHDSDLRLLERKYIIGFCPPFNIQHKPAKI